jgi:hypothetical protein
MRAVDIFIFCICLNLGIGFVNAMLAESQETAFLQNQSGAGWEYNRTLISGFNQSQSNIVTDTFAATRWLFSAIFFVLGMLLSIVWIFPILVTTFMVPPPVAAILQTLVYLIYAIGIVQWISGRSTASYE